LAGKKWLENKEPTKPLTENYPEQLPKNIEPPILPNPELFIKPNSPPLITESKPTITNYQPKPAISEISPKYQEKFSPNVITEIKSPAKNNESLPVITSQKEPATTQERILLTKIKQLEEQLKQTQAQNNNLTNQLVKSEQEKKELAVKLANSEKLIQSEKQRAGYYEKQLKTIAKNLYQ